MLKTLKKSSSFLTFSQTLLSAKNISCVDAAETNQNLATEILDLQQCTAREKAMRIALTMAKLDQIYTQGKQLR